MRSDNNHTPHQPSLMPRAETARSKAPTRQDTALTRRVEGRVHLTLDFGRHH